MTKSNGTGTVPLGGTVSGTTVGAIAELAQLMESSDDPSSAIQLRERMAEIELALEDLGWVRMGMQTQGQLSRPGLRKLTTICRQLYLKHPLINHGVNIQTNYVWGQGISVVSKTPEINAVVQAWWDLKANKAEITGHRARMLKERELAVAGNIFLALFTDPIRGTVRVRSILVDEIEDIITNPEDRREPWFYHRRWASSDGQDLTTGLPMQPKTQEAFYPDWLYKPKAKPKERNGVPIKWDAPVYHMKVGGLDNMLFGVPEIFPAIDWARAVQADLEAYATVRKAFSKFAFNLTVKGGTATTAAARAMLATTISADASSTERNPPPTGGSTFIQRKDVASLEPIKTSGMQPHPDEGRRVGLMVTAGLGIPEPMLFGDATLGNYATAKSLDRPTELQMVARQQDWVDTFTDLLGYVVDANGFAGKGALKSRNRKDDYSGELVVEILGSDGKPLDRGLAIAFPAILEHDPKDEVQAIVTATTLNGQAPAGMIDKRTITRLLLVALRVPNVDELLNAIHPDEPNPPEVDPGAPPSPAPPPADPAPVADSPAATEALKQMKVLSDAIARIPIKPDVDLPALIAQLAETLRPNLEPLAELLRGQTEALSAVASRSIAVEVNLPPTPRRKVTKETKFKADEKGRITGKTETETEGDE